MIYISLLELVVAILTLLVAFVAYKKFLANKLVGEQFQLIQELIEKIHTSTQQLRTKINKGDKSYFAWNWSAN